MSEKLVSFGNHKLPNDIMIFNLGTAKDCPSRKLNLCPVYNREYNLGSKAKCYAYKAEQQYPKTVPGYRNRQGKLWNESTTEELINYFSGIIERKRTKVKYFRLNEASDFRTQQDISKCSSIAKALKDKFDIISYCYTARKDLDFSNVNFLVIGSNWKAPNGMSIVLDKNESVPSGYIECPMDCRICDVCRTKKYKNIAFYRH